MLPVVGSLNGNDDFKYIARTIRKNMDLSDTWYESCTNMNAAFNYVRSRLEESGIVVMLNGVVGKIHIER